MNRFSCCNSNIYFAWVYRVWCLVPFISNVRVMITDTMCFSDFVSTGKANLSRGSTVSHNFSYLPGMQPLALVPSIGPRDPELRPWLATVDEQRSLRVVHGPCIHVALRPFACGRSEGNDAGALSWAWNGMGHWVANLFKLFWGGQSDKQWHDDMIWHGCEWISIMFHHFFGTARQEGHSTEKTLSGKTVAPCSWWQYYATQ